MTFRPAVIGTGYLGTAHAVCMADLGYRRAGGAVTVYDPVATENARVRYPELGYASSAPEAAAGADVVLHLTEWREFRDLYPRVLSAVVRERRIVDGRNALDPVRWRAAGWTYRALGRP